MQRTASPGLATAVCDQLRVTASVSAVVSVRVFVSSQYMLVSAVKLESATRGTPILAVKEKPMPRWNVSEVVLVMVVLVVRVLSPDMVTWVFSSR